MTKVFENMKGCRVIHLQREESYDDFIRQNLRDDGVHIKRHVFKDFLDTTLQLMGLNDDVYQKASLVMDDYIHRERCWICGEKHLRGTVGCDGRLLECNRCTVRGHNQRICLHRAKLCTRCGERGHSNGVCRRGR